jgi:hypothetical protein
MNISIGFRVWPARRTPRYARGQCLQCPSHIAIVNSRCAHIYCHPLPSSLGSSGAGKLHMASDLRRYRPGGTIWGNYVAVQTTPSSFRAPVQPAGAGELCRTGAAGMATKSQRGTIKRLFRFFRHQHSRAQHSGRRTLAVPQNNGPAGISAHPMASSVLLRPCLRHGNRGSAKIGLATKG